MLVLTKSMAIVSNERAKHLRLHLQNLINGTYHSESRYNKKTIIGLHILQLETIPQAQERAGIVLHNKIPKYLEFFDSLD